MDNMHISSTFMTRIISKIIEKEIYKKTGSKVAVQLNTATVRIEEGLVRAHLDISAELAAEDINKILKNKVI